ncbi:MAG: NAD(P)/FAD-dependent oxidoreductase [Gammaproteobacteria bacterium]|nr:NAD(P)/FAD-dependent oxidoreductase [Gammaproteobacteria bacterium]
MSPPPSEGCDVLIIGGGPAGSTCARALRRAGLDVLVMDRQEFPRDKVCAGWITPAVVDLLELETEEYRQGRVFQPITSFLTGIEGGRQVATAYGREVSFGIRRREFDHYLLQRSGARLALGEALDSMRRTERGWVVNDRVETRLVIGAGGHFCPVARYLGARPGRGEVAVAAQEIEFELDAEQQRACRIAPHTPELFFCDDMQGYGWCFRKGNFLNVGLGREGGHNLSRHVQAFRAALIAQGKIPPGTPTDFHGHAYLLYSSARRIVADDGVLLIGDAAGLAYPQSGEGIRPAIESALMAAQCVLAARGDYRRDRLTPYQERLAARYGLRAEPASRGVAPERLKQALASWLLRSRWFARHVVLDRWFLHAHEKPLITHPL